MLGLRTDAEIIRFSDTAKIIDRCKPWDNHLESEAYDNDKINKALRSSNSAAAWDAIINNSKPTADPSCLDVLNAQL